MDSRAQIERVGEERRKEELVHDGAGEGPWSGTAVSGKNIALYRDGKLGLPPGGAMRLLPVSVADDQELAKPGPTEVASSRLGAIYIEVPGEVRISLEGSVDPAVVCAVLKSLRP
jgi:hypothetical protein